MVSSLVSLRAPFGALRVVGRISAGRPFEAFEEREQRDIWSILGPPEELSYSAGRDATELIVYRRGRVVGTIRAVDFRTRYAVAILRRTSINRLAEEYLDMREATQVANSFNSLAQPGDEAVAVLVPQPMAESIFAPSDRSRSA